MKTFVLPSCPYWSSFSTPQQSSIPLNVHSQYFSTRAIAQRRRRARQLAAITEIASAVKHADALSSLHARPSNLQQTRPTIQPPSSNDSQNGVLTNIDGRRSHQRSIPHMLIARRPFTDPTRPVSFARMSLFCTQCHTLQPHRYTTSAICRCAALHLRPRSAKFYSRTNSQQQPARPWTTKVVQRACQRGTECRYERRTSPHKAHDPLQRHQMGSRSQPERMRF
ncbi:hypothetical protein BC826DRAFT_433840 [Russula brevipes]|nr:hypothetical protein BC826DRAFT_433840 [Russula brevipes]